MRLTPRKTILALLLLLVAVTVLTVEAREYNITENPEEYIYKYAEKRELDIKRFFYTKVEGTARAVFEPRDPAAMLLDFKPVRVWAHTGSYPEGFLDGLPTWSIKSKAKAWYKLPMEDLPPLMYVDVEFKGGGNGTYWVDKPFRAWGRAFYNVLGSEGDYTFFTEWPTLPVSGRVEEQAYMAWHSPWGAVINLGAMLLGGEAHGETSQEEVQLSPEVGMADVDFYKGWWMEPFKPPSGPVTWTPPGYVWHPGNYLWFKEFSVKGWAMDELTVSTRTGDGLVNVGSVLFEREGWEELAPPSKVMVWPYRLYGVKAVPPQGYAFSRWEASGGARVSDTGSQQTVVHTENSNGSLTAVFEKLYSLTVRAEGDGFELRGVAVTVNGKRGSTPLTVTLKRGVYAVEAPESVTVNGRILSFREAFGRYGYVGVAPFRDDKGNYKWQLWVFLPLRSYWWFLERRTPTPIDSDVKLYSALNITVDTDGSIYARCQRGRIALFRVVLYNEKTYIIEPLYEALKQRGYRVHLYITHYVPYNNDYYHITVCAKADIKRLLENVEPILSHKRLKALLIKHALRDPSRPVYWNTIEPIYSEIKAVREEMLRESKFITKSLHEVLQALTEKRKRREITYTQYEEESARLRDKTWRTLEEVKKKYDEKFKELEKRIEAYFRARKPRGLSP